MDDRTQSAIPGGDPSERARFATNFRTPSEFVAAWIGDRDPEHLQVSRAAAAPASAEAAAIATNLASQASS